MEKRAFEKLGIEASLLGYGGMRFPQKDGKIDVPEAEKLIHRAMEAGITYYDTAYFYHNGESEAFLGNALKQYDRTSYYLATKLPPWDLNSLEDVDKVFNDQLSKLQTDYVDFYLLHAMNKELWAKVRDMGCVEHLEKLQAEGKIRYLGFSFHDDYDVLEDILNYRDWDFCQVQLNYMDTEEQAGMRGYELTVEKQVPLVIMEPVKGGMLATFADDITEKFRAVNPQASTASFALRWVGSLPNVKVILSGMSNFEQLEDNLKTFGEFKPLSEAEQNAVDEVVALLRSRVQNGCTGCRYCMPCPVGVDIPGCFNLWNTYHMYRQYDLVKWGWEQELAEKQAKKCIQCGKCEAVCPQKLSIRENLKSAQADLDNKVW